MASANPEAHMQQIIDALTNRKCVLFAGAGISRDAGLPGWLGLGQMLRDKLTREGKLTSPLADLIAPLCQDPQNVPAAIEVMLTVVPRNYVVEALRTILAPSRASQVCAIISKLGLRGVVTTNYDRVIESSLPSSVFRLTNSLEKLKQVPTAVGSGQAFLLKLHGDIDDGLGPSDPLVGRKGAPFMVLSSGDYAALVQGDRCEALILALHSILQETSVLFLGYGFSDPDIAWMLRLLAQHCRFPHMSWYIGLKGERLPHLPENVTGISELGSWDDLPAWLSDLSQTVSNSKASKKKEPRPEVHPAEALSDEKKRAFLAVGQYLTDLESTSLAERVLASALLEEVSKQAEFSFEWLTSKVAKIIEVGPIWAEGLASVTAGYLKQLKLVESLPDGRFRTVKNAVQTLESRALGEWQKDRDRFYRSIAQKLGMGGATTPHEFTLQLDAVLCDLCVNFGQGMAEWVHRGIGRELGWQHAKELVKAHFKDREDIRKANAVLELVFSQPSDDEVPYLYRLLGAAFLANSVRLDPSAASVVRTTLSSYELYLDTNILLPLVIEEHDDHRSMKAITEESRDAGVKLFVIQAMFDEMCGHRDLATRTVDDCEQDISRLSEVVEVFGKRANCFLQGYLNTLSQSELNEKGANAASASVTWKAYQERYTADRLRERLQQMGLSVVPSDEDPMLSVRYNNVLNAITQEWRKRARGRERPPILNENEARQFVHIYRRRGELGAADVTPQVWFLSYETVLASVFERNASEWGMPPTFPFSAWVAFLDSRLPWVPKDPSAIVNAILKGHSSAFDLPEWTTLVRKKAFGDRVITKAEDEATLLALSPFSLVRKALRSRNAILHRGHLSDATHESREARKAAVAEISSALDENIVRLHQQLAKKREELTEAEAKLQQVREELEKVKAQDGGKPKRVPRPKRRRRI